MYACEERGNWKLWKVVKREKNKEKKYVYGKERKKNRKVKIKVWENERVIEKEEKERRGVARKIWEGWMKWKEK